MFQGLKSLTITSELESTHTVLARVVKMMHSNLALEKIVLDSSFQSHESSMSFLLMLICHPIQPERPVFVWPNLRHLIIRTLTGPLWHVDILVDLVTLFLVLHLKIETLGFSITGGLGLNGTVDHQFSLSLHPWSLPRLKLLLGSAYFIAGILESRSACLSVVSVIDDCLALCKNEQDVTPQLDRIVAALEAAPTHRISRLHLMEFSRAAYANFICVARRIQFLDFTRPPTGTQSEFDALVSLPLQFALQKLVTLTMSRSLFRPS